MKRVCNLLLIFLGISYIHAVEIEGIKAISQNEFERGFNKNSARQTRQRTVAGQNQRHQVIATRYLFHVVNTTNFQAATGGFSQQTEGVMAVDKQEMQNGNYSYTYNWLSLISPVVGKAYERKFEPCIIIRKPETDRFVGGNKIMKNYAVISNSSLNQIRSRIEFNGYSKYSSKIKINLTRSSGFPGAVEITLNAGKYTLDSGRPVVIVTTFTDQLSYTLPGGDKDISGRFGSFYVVTPDLEDILFQYESFKATENDGTLFLSTMTTQINSKGKSLNFQGLNNSLLFKVFSREIGPLEAGSPLETTMVMPNWAMHSLAVRDVASLASGAVVEGRPNFVITATIGMVLLADSAISAGSYILKETGVIENSWDGIPNYLGKQAGLGAARVAENYGHDVDNEQWGEVGGVVGDVAGLTLSFSKLGTKVGAMGIKVGTSGYHKGFKFMSYGHQTKMLRFSKQGLTLINGRGNLPLWMIDGANSVQKTINTLKVEYSVTNALNGLLDDSISEISVSSKKLSQDEGKVDGIRQISDQEFNDFFRQPVNYGYEFLNNNTVQPSTSSNSGNPNEDAGTVAPHAARLANVTVSVVDATNARPIGMADVVLYKQGNATPLKAVKTIAQGKCSFRLLPGVYLITAEKDKYIKWKGTFQVLANKDNPIFKIAMSPILNRNTKMRIVLTWGASPRDLDSHLFQSNNYHVYYAKKRHSEALLDVDDTSAYGPETITIKELNQGRYRYCVHDFSNKSRSGSMSLFRSGAKVKVYLSNGENMEFDVPNRPGNTWHVFTIDGRTGKVTREDKMLNQSNPVYVGR